MTQCELGRTYKDKVTGLTGVAVCRTEWLGGCVRIGLQAKLKEDGRVPKLKEFDEPQLVLQKGVKIIKVSEPEKPEHGPRPSPERR